MRMQDVLVAAVMPITCWLTLQLRLLPASCVRSELGSAPNKLSTELKDSSGRSS